MSKKVRLNLDELKVQSFVTTIDPKEQAAMFGAADSLGPVCGSYSLRCQSITCETGIRCDDTGTTTGTDSLTCVPDTTYCTQYEPWKC